jgi:hypothetical protein
MGPIIMGGIALREVFSWIAFDDCGTKADAFAAEATMAIAIMFSLEGCIAQTDVRSERLGWCNCRESERNVMGS